MLVLVLAAITVPAARLALAYIARRRRWADPNPRRAADWPWQEQFLALLAKLRAVAVPMTT